MVAWRELGWIVLKEAVPREQCALLVDAIFRQLRQDPEPDLRRAWRGEAPQQDGATYTAAARHQIWDPSFHAGIGIQH